MKHNNRKVSRCDGYNYDPHPTERKLKTITAFRGTESEVTVSLCPECLKEFNREVQEATKAYDEANNE